VENRRAALSSASSTLGDLVDRVTGTADALLADGEESLAHELYEVERSLQAALRRLDGVARRMR
jgi:hypothetical protein